MHQNKSWILTTVSFLFKVIPRKSMLEASSMMCFYEDEHVNSVQLISDLLRPVQVSYDRLSRNCHYARKVGAKAIIKKGQTTYWRSGLLLNMM